MIVDRVVSFPGSVCVDERVTVVKKLVGDFLGPATDSAVKIEFEEIFAHLLDDPDVKVRQALAHGLAFSDKAPRAVIWGLIQDIPNVSVVLFRHSPLLHNSHLLHALQAGTPDIQEAIAARGTLDKTIVQSLSKIGCAQAIVCLLNNRSVVMGQGLLYDIAERLGDVPNVRHALLNGAVLSMETRQLLVQKTCDAITRHLGDKGWMKRAQLVQAAGDTRNRMTMEMSEKIGDDGIENFVAHLKSTGQLSTALLIRALCTGNARFFEVSFAALCNVSLRRVQAIVDQGRTSSFKSLYSVSGLAQSAYPVFHDALTVWEELNADDGIDHTAVIEKIIDRVCQRETIDGAILDMLTRLATEARKDGRLVIKPQLLLAA